ncbi:PadR family transcriptional regulator, regulatory protein PadR [Micromonospora matsumotoense]|uniref:PadR family transcriptional regulator, regulatory protein PadR n=1 Tax=Micromonospora matsumotoense TaxID=121616 RepID=A0A1C5APR3_9ACTN|nr:PadR family transcriptional regulator [Micromonospora matsumotoense]SCF47202.1 PadR family transcriptional regulator, regulatory protein PadR [Micromonospora matsumotoense]
MQTDPKLVALRRGLLEPLVLAAVESRQRYAAEILAALQEADFPAQEGTLYPLLSRLRRDGLVQHEWHESPSGPPRKYFSLTKAGRDQLAAFREYWNELTHMISTMGR